MAKGRKVQGGRILSQGTVCMYVSTVEIGSLHTLWLESLKLIFPPLHKISCSQTIVLISRFGQVIFPTVVYRQIISLIIFCITIPVGQKFTFAKLTVPLNSLEIPENYVMSLEASESLIDNILSELEVYLWMYFKANLQKNSAKASEFVF